MPRLVQIVIREHHRRPGLAQADEVPISIAIYSPTLLRGLPSWGGFYGSFAGVRPVRQASVAAAV